MDQWDLQTVDGTVNAVRYGVIEGDPEHTQTLAALKTRITTGADSDAFADDRIANASGLNSYYRTMGAYGDIDPSDGATTTFTPASPPAAMTCAGGTAVTDPDEHRALVHDCEVLLDAKSELAGTATLNWIAIRALLTRRLGRRDDGRHARARDGAGAVQREPEREHPGGPGRALGADDAEPLE